MPETSPLPSYLLHGLLVRLHKAGTLLHGLPHLCHMFFGVLLSVLLQLSHQYFGFFFFPFLWTIFSFDFG